MRNFQAARKVNASDVLPPSRSLYAGDEMPAQNDPMREMVKLHMQNRPSSIGPHNQQEIDSSRRGLLDAIAMERAKTAPAQDAMMGDALLQQLAAQRRSNPYAAMNNMAAGGQQLAGRTMNTAGQESVREAVSRTGAANALLGRDMGYETGMGALRNQWQLGGNEMGTWWDDLDYRNQLARERSALLYKNTRNQAITAYNKAVQDQADADDAAASLYLTTASSAF